MKLGIVWEKLRRKKHWWVGWGLAMAGLAGMAEAAAKIYFHDRFPAGVWIAGVEAGGRKKAEVEQELAAKAAKLKGWKLAWGTLTYELKSEDINLKLNFKASLESEGGGKFEPSAFRWLRELAKTNRQPPEKKLEIEYTFDRDLWEAVVEKIAGDIEVPAQEPQILFRPEGKRVEVTRGENGRRVDRARLESELVTKIGNLEGGVVNIPIVNINPRLDERQAQMAYERALAMVGKRLEVEIEGEPEIRAISDEELISWIDPGSNGWRMAKIIAWGENLAAVASRPAQNAIFRFTGTGRVEEFKPERMGLKVNSGEAVAAILQGAKELGEKQTARVTVPATPVEPKISAGEINELGIKELIGKGESWYAGSITNRIYNLRRAAEAINGTLVAPGEVFSFNQAVGEISQATGYKSAFIIKDGKTILGDGGGVCQTSSTLFRAALNAGLPILERTAHAYRVSYYEQNYRPGFDATIFQPAPDFKFANDTPGHILIQMVFDEQKKYLAFEIYGTNDGRKVEISNFRIWDVVAPPPDLYLDDPNLPAGEVRQTEKAARGAKVAFDWKVTRGEEVLQQRTFFSNYRPWQAVYLRGTKTN